MIKTMRSGYTTGACATAGTKAALLFLLQNKVVDSVDINSLQGELIHIPVKNVQRTDNGVSAEIIKNAGDDPDITNGVSIYTEVCLNENGKINFIGGKGVGRVTKKGMSIPVGEPAINPGPREMMTIVVKELLAGEQGCDIIISIPDGEELAKRTLNPILGIEGGISVIGTSGIVRPMSEEGFKNSLTPQVDVAYAAGYKSQIFVPGKIGENIALKFGLPQAAIIQTSNFIGHMLEYAAGKKLQNVLFVGHLGKLVKIAAGNFHTHSKVSDARMETLAAYSGALGMDSQGINDILDCVTTEAAMAIISQYGLSDRLYPLLCEKASMRSMRHVYNDLTVGTIMVTLKGEILGMDENAKKIGREFNWNIK
ncbi:cobalt-precorrin-5B (C(1))-methyltransferase CbiD [Pectinatus brassicae]|uniref:Cobalt-precorrin-5B C(1)-methyltransferase n=1 Tax=Pectinatus brassicae TaxID=862415 RepID=A0A840UX31_9FIRM|nr:cobalt-precorrin-5B (C(1))-methyltransferase CbiD [Pectinatus brassicae]MBB5337414.1 cobalt-precorrin-5B (C1)-methyltransferase [Pectinatus brassicae]